jgi:hypothetical protein
MHRISYAIYVAFGEGGAAKRRASHSPSHYYIPFLLRILRIIIYNIVIASGF